MFGYGNLFRKCVLTLFCTMVVLPFVLWRFYIPNLDSSEKSPSRPQKKEASRSHFFLVPYLDSLGPAMACEREELGGLEDLLIEYEVGVPFGRSKITADDVEDLLPLPPKVAVWSDGTIIWTASDQEGEPVFKARLPRQKIATTAAKIRELKSQLAKLPPTDSAIASRYGTVSSISLTDADDSIAIYSELEQMEKLGTYWYLSGEKYREFDSFESFCRFVPNRWIELQQLYSAARLELRKAIPKEGKEIDPSVDLKWVVQFSQPQ